jgi:DNA invertase Pin-like site-specific DNA recombinase
MALRQFGRSFALATRQASRQASSERTLIRVRGIADRRGLALGLPVAYTGRPRRLDYADLTVMLAAGLSQSECARRLGVGRSAVSKALIRNRELRRRVNRLEHASGF